MSLTRRDVIKAGVFAGAAMSLPLSRVVSGQSALANRMPSSKLPKPFTTPFAMPPVAVPVPSKTDPTTDYYQLTMKEIQLEIVPGFKTTFFAYVDDSTGYQSVPGPTIQAFHDRKVVVRHRNTLPPVHPTLGYVPWTSVHLHGSASLPQFDGYASDITLPGQFKDYHYPNFQNARTMWYHDHGVEHTAENAYHGLIAQYHLHDAQEQALAIPHDPYDIPLIIGDALFNNDGSLLFTLEDQSGLWGDVILVNGRPWPVMQVEPRKYRFRILGVAISRSWKFSLDSGGPMTIIGTDGGLMPGPQDVTSFRAASSERYEVIIDFAKYSFGQRVILKNSSPKNNRNFANTDKIMAFDIVKPLSNVPDPPIPTVLNPNHISMNLRPQDAVGTRRFITHRKHGQWIINDHNWADVIKSGFTLTEANPRFGDVEIWEFVNDSGGWFHPAHIHLVDFQILDRNGKPPFAQEIGPKDVAYIGEGETVRLLTKFGEGRGRYMMHCHNLIHEDHDMMGQFEVIDPAMAAPDPLDPATSARSLADEGTFPP